VIPVIEVDVEVEVDVVDEVWVEVGVVDDVLDVWVEVVVGSGFSMQQGSDNNASSDASKINVCVFSILYIILV